MLPRSSISLAHEVSNFPNAPRDMPSDAQRLDLVEHVIALGLLERSPRFSRHRQQEPAVSLRWPRIRLHTRLRRATHARTRDSRNRPCHRSWWRIQLVRSPSLPSESARFADAAVRPIAVRAASSRQRDPVGPTPADPVPDARRSGDSSDVAVTRPAVGKSRGVRRAAASPRRYRTVIPAAAPTGSRRTERILATHTGSMPRPRDVADLLIAQDRGQPVDQDVFDETMRRAVSDVVAGATACRSRHSERR